jgi:hypothetical protein
MLDEFNSTDYPGETVAFKEVFKNIIHKYKFINYVAIRKKAGLGKKRADY